MKPSRTATTRRYAEGTVVQVEASRAELEKLLTRHGATHIGVYSEPERSTVLYKMGERYIRHTIERPTEKTKRGSRPVDPEREFRRRWRVLVLITKAKLEMIAAGDSTIEREFLADVVLADKSTVYETARASIAETYETGKMPRFLLGPGGA